MLIFVISFEIIFCAENVYNTLNTKTINTKNTNT